MHNGQSKLWDATDLYVAISSTASRSYENLYTAVGYGTGKVIGAVELYSAASSKAGYLMIQTELDTVRSIHVLARQFYTGRTVIIVRIVFSGAGTGAGSH